MKGQNPFQAFLSVVVLLVAVVSLAASQQVQLGFVAGQGRPRAATALQRVRGRTDGGVEVGTPTFRKQPALRPIARAQVLQRANNIPPPQETVTFGQQSVTQQPTQQPLQPVATQRVVPQANLGVPVTNQPVTVVQNAIPQQQQQAFKGQQRIVQIPAAQPQQVTVSQQRPTQVFRQQQQPVAQRVVQIPAQQQVALGQQRLSQTVTPQQPAIITQQQGVQIPQQQQRFAAPTTNNGNFLQSDPQQATRDSAGNTGFAQDAFPTQGNVGVPQTIQSQNPLPAQRKRVRKQKVRNNNSNIGNFPDDLTEDELEARREWEEILAEQARNAHYSFSSTVEDGLNDQLVARQETREGLLTRGSYSYSDGFFQRTVHYEADENGYRVTSQDIQAIGDGPQPDPNGSAHVTSEFGNARNEYAITAADLAPPAPEESITGSI